MTLEEFEAKARAGGYKKVLNSEYYKSRIARLKDLQAQLSKMAEPYADNETNYMGLAKVDQYKNTYLLDNYANYVALGEVVNLNHFNEQTIRDLVYQPWHGKTFSQRIWKNYTKILPEVLTDGLLRGVLLGQSPKKITSILRDKFKNVKESYLHRLVVTELGHTYEQATSQFYKDSDIKYYQYLATLESHTCEVCAKLDGRVFKVKDEKAGINYPLIHPYCRCTTMPYDETLPPIETRWYRDPKTGKGAWGKPMSFNSWKKYQESLNPEIGHNIKLLSQQKSIKITTLREFTKAVNELGIKHVKNMGGVDAQVLNGIYQTLSNEFSNHPELEGFLTTVKGGNRNKSSDVAYVKASLKFKSGNTLNTARYSYDAELNINKPKLSNVSEANKMVEKNCKKKWWTYKNDYTGLIKHEIAHAIDYRAMYAQVTNNDKLRALTYNEAIKIQKEFKVHSFATDALLDIFEKIKIFEPTNGDIEKYISGYAKKGGIPEAFAEAYSDESRSEFSRNFAEILKHNLKELYK